MTELPDLIDADALIGIAGDTGLRIVDTRFDLLNPAKGLADYEAGHIPGAVYADLDKDLASEITAHSGRHPLPDLADFRARLESWGIADETMVVVYDGGNGALAARLWWMLKIWLGHPDVAVLDGGLAAWLQAGGDLETATPTYPSASYTREANSTVVVSTEEIARAIEAASELNLLDAREAARFRGEQEPIDTVAGHVPGARNLPLSTHVKEDGTFKSADELAASWSPHFGGDDDNQPVVMCGSGVTACHLALSAVLAGRPAPRLYVGSWSEWIRDPGRPVSTGD